MCIPGVPGRESHGFLDSHLNNLKSSLIVIDEESNSFFFDNMKKAIVET